MPGRRCGRETVETFLLGFFFTVLFQDQSRRRKKNLPEILANLIPGFFCDLSKLD